MYSLFIDTHDKDIVLVLFKDEKVLASSIKTSERGHTEFIMPKLEVLLKEQNVSVHDLSEILVVNGPGSFTGVRLGVTIAKTLAYTLQIPIKTITSLEAYAVSDAYMGEKLMVIHDVKGVYGSVFEENKQKGEAFYLANQDFETVKAKYSHIIESTSLDFEKIRAYMKEKKAIPAHQVKPLYVKVIEALK